jgi:diaminohydroxyphosphoribosylaminopyrimidine deaminase / 5-amino-6-(5-phosphoribosylamino)uracil reductase
MSRNVEGTSMEQAAHEGSLDEARAWALCTALAARASSGRPLTSARGLRLGAGDVLEETPLGHGLIDVDPARETGLPAGTRLPPAIAAMLELYLPLCLTATGRVVYGHVGQSLDGQIATQSGASRYVTGQANLCHMHRLRALCDAVIVGAGTALHDDPQLTTRLVPGRSPTRVVIDPTLRLPEQRKLFQDRAAPTLVICARGRLNGHRLGASEIVEVEAEDGLLPPPAIVRTLRERGLSRLFVEGGGVTVSRFVESNTLDRLHVTVCPIFIGRGRPGISLPGIDQLDRALRPRTRRFAQDDDVLFDCKL